MVKRRLGGDVEKGRGEAGVLGRLEKAGKAEEGKGGIECTREYGGMPERK